MPRTIPNLVLHDKPVPLAKHANHGRRHVFVNCGNPDCYHNAELDVSGLPDNVTFGELQRRMLCTACEHRGARRWPVLAASWLIGRAPSTIPFPCPAAANSPEDSARGLLRMGGPQKKRQWRSTILHAEERARKTVDIAE
jgi:hypothetical protein